MPMLTSQVFGFLDSPKIQQSKYFQNKTLLFLKNEIIHYKLNFVIWPEYCFLALITTSKTFFLKKNVFTKTELNSKSYN